MQKNNLKITRYAIACAHCRHALTCYYHADDVINAAEADDVINSSFIHAYEQSTLLLSNLVVSKLKKKRKNSQQTPCNFLNVWLR